MKIRPKVPVCTDCDHVFEYRGRNPGQLGGVVVQFGEAYCTKKKKPRLLKRWHNMLRVPDWCKKRIRPSLVRIYDFASTESWLMHENLCKSLGREISPTASRYTLSEVRQLDLDAYAFQKQIRTTPVEELLNVHLGLHQVVEVFDGVQSVILYAESHCSYGQAHTRSGASQDGLRRFRCVIFRGSRPRFFAAGREKGNRFS